MDVHENLSYILINLLITTGPHSPPFPCIPFQSEQPHTLQMFTVKTCMEELKKKIPKKNILILMCDFKAKIGKAVSSSPENS